MTLDVHQHKVDAGAVWLHNHLGRVSATSDLAKAIRYAIRHWDGLVVFLDDGRVEMGTPTSSSAPSDPMP